MSPRTRPAERRVVVTGDRLGHSRGKRCPVQLAGPPGREERGSANHPLRGHGGLSHPHRSRGKGIRSDPLPGFEGGSPLRPVFPTRDRGRRSGHARRRMGEGPDRRAAGTIRGGVRERDRGNRDARGERPDPGGKRSQARESLLHPDVHPGHRGGADLDPIRSPGPQLRDRVGLCFERARDRQRVTLHPTRER